MYIPHYGDILHGTYQVLDFLRMTHEIYAYKVQHIKTKQYFALKLLDFKTSNIDIVLMFVNEVRVLAAFDHPLVTGFEEVFVDAEEAIIW